MKQVKTKMPSILFQMPYDFNIKTLLKKYGKVQGNYFLTDSFKSKNSKITRTKDHLYIHHIREDKAIMLSQTKYACKHSYEYQKAENLVYCNLVEHAILHMCICLQNQNPDDKNELLGFGGLFNFIVPELIDHFAGWEYKTQYWRNEENEFLKPYLDSFIIIYADFLFEIIFSNNCNTNKFCELLSTRKGRKLDILDLVPSQSLSFYGNQCPDKFIDSYSEIVTRIQWGLRESIKDRKKDKIIPNKYIDINSIMKK